MTPPVCWYVSGPLNGTPQDGVEDDTGRWDVSLMDDRRTPLAVELPPYAAQPPVAMHQRIGNLLVYVGTT